MGSQQGRLLGLAALATLSHPPPRVSPPSWPPLQSWDSSRYPQGHFLHLRVSLCHSSSPGASLASPDVLPLGAICHQQPPPLFQPCQLSCDSPCPLWDTLGTLDRSPFIPACWGCPTGHVRDTGDRGGSLSPTYFAPFLPAVGTEAMLRALSPSLPGGTRDPPLPLLPWAQRRAGTAGTAEALPPCATPRGSLAPGRTPPPSG